MAKVDIINLNGEKVKDIKLNDAIYNIEGNEVVVKKALDLQLASFNFLILFIRLLSTKGPFFKLLAIYILLFSLSTNN